MPDFIGTPQQRIDQYPWRPMDSLERRADWARKYYLQYRPHQHPSTEGVGSFDVRESRDE